MRGGLTQHAFGLVERGVVAVGEQHRLAALFQRFGPDAELAYPETALRGRDDDVRPADVGVLRILAQAVDGAAVNLVHGIHGPVGGHGDLAVAVAHRDDAEADRLAGSVGRGLQHGPGFGEQAVILRGVGGDTGDGLGILQTAGNSG